MVKITTGFLVFGAQESFNHVLSAIPYTTDPSQPFDAVAVLPNAQNHTIFNTLAQQGRLLAPIANFSGSPLAREDYTAPAPSQEEFEQACASFDILQQQLQSLPDFSNSADREAFLALALAHTRKAPIRASWAAHKAELVHYPLLTGLANPRAILEDLAGAKLLRRTLFDRVHICSNCASSRLNAREECIHCRSSHLDENALVHHYPCGYQGPEYLFLKERQLICPKCHKTLRHYGVDYDKPGTVLVCNACQQEMAAPEVGFVCTDCGQHIKGDNIDTQDWYHYELLPDALTTLQSGILPYRALASFIHQIPGAVSVNEFTAVLASMIRICGRYKRSMAAAMLVIENLSELRIQLGSQGVNTLFRLCGEMIAQIVRHADVVAANQDRLFLLMPETSPNHAHTAFKRIHDTLKQQTSHPMDIEFRLFDQTNADELLEHL